MALSNEDVQRLNLISPAANDLKLGDIIQSLLKSGGSAEIPDKSITNAKLADNSVLNRNIGDGSVQSRNIGTGSVQENNLSAKSVTMAKLGDDVKSALDGKLTATKAAAQANSTASDVESLVEDFNALLAKLKAAGLMS
ncbi:head fiber protein [Bacillus glycinifermentans]|uniref:head fiber protein n=1 Tax=Bacillus glycinifermentans TaxID=1664069 RepID=UPI001F501052|nr:head fiber protein [Bacillus glycinifermentans]